MGCNARRATSARRGAWTTRRGATSSSARARSRRSSTCKGLKLVVDCAHGAAYHIAPHVFHELGADVVSIGAKPDGFNINDGSARRTPGAAGEVEAQQRRPRHRARRRRRPRRSWPTRQGSRYDGDQLLYVIARHRAARKSRAGRRGRHADDQPRLRAGARASSASPFARAKVGDRYVLEMLREQRLAARRRELRAHHLPRQAHDRRRHRLGAAGARCDARVGPLACRAHRGAGDVSADA